MNKKLTINDIAKMSGVAKSTVSRYLNGGSVRPATGQKIKKIIEENNYEPNVFARLKAKESRVIGLTVPGFDSVTTPRLVEVIVEYLKKNDYTPLIMHTGNSIAEEIRSIERLKNMNVDGIMVLATSTTKEYEEVVKCAYKFQSFFLDRDFQERIQLLTMIIMRDIRLENISEKEPLNKFICCGFPKKIQQLERNAEEE